MMDHGKGNIMNKENIAFICGVVVTVITTVACITYYSYQRDQAMKSNIESAIVKGIDPIAVRCAYADRSDTICMVYSAKK